MDSPDVAACWEANAETWTRHARAGYDLYRDALNTPAFLAELPPVAGLDGRRRARASGGAGHPRSLAGERGAKDCRDIAKKRNKSAADPLMSMFDGLG